MRRLHVAVHRLRTRPRLLGVPIAVVMSVGVVVAVASPDDGSPEAGASPDHGSRSVAPPTPDRRPEPTTDVMRADELVAAPVTASTRPAAASQPSVPPSVVPPEAPAPGPAEPEVNRPPPRRDRVAPAPAEIAPPGDEESTAVYSADFPDPYVLSAHGSYWAFSTQVGLEKVPALRSTDLLHWERVGDALHRLPAWAEWGHNWAPSVLRRGTSFVMYYTTRHAATGLQCISRAVSALPQGPYLDSSERPMICQTERGGSIDPSPFVDAGGRAWLLWKSEGTLAGEPTRIWVQELGPDGQHLRGSPTQLLEREQDWERPIIEGPSMVLVDGRHHLLYSGNRWETAGYAVGHAACDSVVGPCRRTSAGPVLASRRGEEGPGGQEVTVAPTGEPVLVHHAWAPGAVGPEAGGARRLHVSSLRFTGDRLEVGGPWRRQAPGVTDAITIGGD